MFPTISYYAVDFIFAHGAHVGTLQRLRAYCAPSASYSLAYTGFPAVDSQLCGLVAFFHFLLEPRNLPLNVELFTGLAAVATIPYIEAARQNRSVFLELHWIIGMIYQKYTGGVILPIYWLLFVITGAASLHRTPRAGLNSKVDQKYAESIVFALLAGYAAPTVSMLFFTSPHITAFWQAFPLWMFLSQRFYLTLLRPASSASGASTIKFIYTLLFLSSALPHIYLITPLLVSSSGLKSLELLFVPSVALLDPASTSIEQGVLDFIQWDGAFIFLSAFVSTLWVAGSSVRGLVGLIVWLLVSAVVVGPGASLVGVFWWREGLLNKAQDRRKTEKRAQ